MPRKRKTDDEDGEQSSFRCDTCGGLTQRCGGWEEAVALCVCSKKSAFRHAQMRTGPDYSDVLTHGGHLAHPNHFSRISGAGR